MDHAEAREWLLDLASEPWRLRELDLDPGIEAAELRAHLGTCAACRADLDAWRATFAVLDLAVRADAAGDEDPAGSLGDLARSAGSITLPAGLRERTLSVARDEAPVPLRPAATRRRSLRPTAWLAIAAALVVFVGGAAIAVERGRQLDQAQAEAERVLNK